jgi:hypothetical protein
MSAQQARVRAWTAKEAKTPIGDPSTTFVRDTAVWTGAHSYPA